MATGGGSILAVEELFSRADPRFIEELRRIQASPQLAGFVDRWKRDPRPWAREQILAYLDLPMDRPGHHPVVKRLFKQAEASGDDGLMAAFLVAFDRLVRRERRKRHRYEWNRQTQETIIHEEEWLSTPRSSIIPQKPPAIRNIDPRLAARCKGSNYIPRGGRLFSYHTRCYLRRRAWRYFRLLGYRRPQDYLAAVVGALRLYRDEDLARGENILDSWGLAHICFRGHSALEFTVSTVQLREDRSLSELNPAPAFVKLWQDPAATDVLLDLIFTARSRTVRAWSVQLLRREHLERLQDLPVETLVRLIDHDDEEIQQFGADLLQSSKGVEKWPLETWLTLLEIQNPTALTTVCDAMRVHVSVSRLDLLQCLKLACAQPTPVARLGLEFLSARKIASADDRRQLSALGEARCGAIAADLARWALGIVGSGEHYDRDIVIRFFDSLLVEMREAAWEWLIAPSAGYHDPALFSRIIETPFDDLRLKLVDHLAQRVSAARSGPSAPVRSLELSHVWCSVLLGVHRGGRQKAKAAAQVAEAIARAPEQAEKLLPVLAVAVRSIRAEMRAGLAAVVSLVESRPELAATVRQHLPELQLEAVA